MTRVELLNDLKKLCEDALKNYKLPTAVQEGDRERVIKSPDVYLMRLPNAESWKKKVPYVIVQFTDGSDKQESGDQPESTAFIRFFITVYDEDESHGALSLVNVMDTLRLALLKPAIIGKQFFLSLSEGLESGVYDYIDPPYYSGEITGKFILPPVEKEKIYFGHLK